MRQFRSIVLAVLAGLAAGMLASCQQLPADCRVGDADTGQLSTRTFFLERLNGCPVGGRH